jgi:hypothetical protein
MTRFADLNQQLLLALCLCERPVASAQDTERSSQPLQFFIDLVVAIAWSGVGGAGSRSWFRYHCVFGRWPAAWVLKIRIRLSQRNTVQAVRLEPPPPGNSVHILPRLLDKVTNVLITGQFRAAKLLSSFRSKSSVIWDKEREEDARQGNHHSQQCKPVQSADLESS